MKRLLFLIMLIPPSLYAVNNLPNPMVFQGMQDYDALTASSASYSSDSDKLDGQHASFFAPQSSTNPFIAGSITGSSVTAINGYAVGDSSTTIQKDASNAFQIKHNVRTWDIGSAIKNTAGNTSRITVSSPTATNFEVPGNWSVVWKCNRTAGNYQAVFSRYQATPAVDQYCFYFEVTPSIKFYINGSGGGETITWSNPAVTIGRDTWYALVVDSNTTCLFVTIDGVTTSLGWKTFIKTMQKVDAALTIGGLRLSTSWPFLGTLDEFKFYNISLTTATVQTICGSGAQTYGLPTDTGIAAIYHFDEGTGTTINDFGVSKNTATVVTTAGTGMQWVDGLVRNPTNVINTSIKIISQADGDANDRGYTYYGDPNSRTTFYGTNIYFSTGSATTVPTPAIHVDDTGLTVDNSRNLCQKSGPTTNFQMGGLYGRLNSGTGFAYDHSQVNLGGYNWPLSVYGGDYTMLLFVNGHNYYRELQCIYNCNIAGYTGYHGDGGEGTGKTWKFTTSTGNGYVKGSFGIGAVNGGTSGLLMSSGTFTIDGSSTTSINVNGIIKGAGFTENSNWSIGITTPTYLRQWFFDASFNLKVSTGTNNCYDWK